MGNVSPFDILFPLIAFGVVLILVRRFRHEAREPEPEPGASNTFPALERSQIPFILMNLGFVRKGHEFTRDSLTVKPVFMRVRADTIDPWPEQLHLNRIGPTGGTLAFEPEFEGTAKPGDAGPDVRVKGGNATSRALWTTFVKKHVNTLQSLSWTALEVFQHRTPRMHLYVRTATTADAAAQIEAAAQALEALWTEVNRD